MEAICQIANENKINLVLKPDTRPDPENPEFDLVKFYRKFGFKEFNNVEMFRNHL